MKTGIFAFATLALLQLTSGQPHRRTHQHHARDSNAYGLSYSPYNDDGSCKSQDQVNGDFDKIDGYDLVRIYGVDCNQVSTVLSAAKGKGMKLFAGLFDISNVDGDIQTIVSAANGDWSSFDTVAVGNELLNSKSASADDVVNAIKTARGLLNGAGFSGSVVTVDTAAAITSNTELCDASDYVALNCHAFFDDNVEASGAGPYVLSQAQEVSAACNNKKTVITESGWPSQGDSNGKAVPSTENQKSAIDSLKNSFSSNLILFTAFNDMWKKNNAGTFNAEQYWGILSD
ncbi:glycoside hydrolase family 17 protein [Xylona heveae TC161]|uniref:Glycoside hydrolase family 17 protein n=1 Tax=Xylona heveae (strain CBS 132557 / TC161) TaxID=1328760 RepID=A0A164ZBZ1_XYLHT|nr:glycoside hydrolase family 17 protein [Xylona heveae TC161]KZF18913.1 glycoside hydrolase family 17 protein [Xylona heveae TC161]